MGRRGPKRRPGKREPNGQLSRASGDLNARRQLDMAKAQWDVMSVAVIARTRVHHIPVSSTLDQRAGSVIGRMIMGEIARQRLWADRPTARATWTPAPTPEDHGLTIEQGDAALRYLEDTENYRRAMCSPPQPGAVDLNAIRSSGGTSPDHAAFVLRAKRRYDGLAKAIADAQSLPRNRGRNLFAALQFAVLRDEFYAHLVPDLRLALDALAAHYGMVNDD